MRKGVAPFLATWWPMASDAALIDPIRPKQQLRSRDWADISAPFSAPFREVTFCASYKCHCFGVKGSRLSWFRPCSALSDLEHVIALATSPRCLGRPRHVQLLLLLGDVGKHRTKALVLDDGSLIDLRPLVEGPIRE